MTTEFNENDDNFEQNWDLRYSKIMDHLFLESVDFQTNDSPDLRDNLLHYYDCREEFTAHERQLEYLLANPVVYAGETNERDIQFILEYHKEVKKLRKLIYETSEGVDELLSCLSSQINADLRSINVPHGTRIEVDYNGLTIFFWNDEKGQVWYESKGIGLRDIKW